MDALVDTKNRVGELHKKIQEHLEELALATDKARTSEEMVRYLDFCAKFHEYSANNIFLIMLSRPDATRVAGYNQWLKLGRHVKRAERGIQILAPLVHKNVDENGIESTHLYGFKVTHVFDFSQTEGDPLPQQPAWKSLGQNDELRKKLMKYAQSKGISVSYEKLDNDTQGASLGGKIILSPSSGVKTLAHELCHEILHHEASPGFSHVEREIEAESAAFIICRHYGLSGLSCPNYNSLQGGTGELILQHFQRILGVAAEIIKFIDCPTET